MRSYRCFYPSAAHRLLYGMQTGFTVQTLALSLSTLLIVECVYEIGYIQNDTETVKRDDSPTWRLNGTELDFYYQHKRVVYISRIIQTIAFLTMLHFFFPHAHTIYLPWGYWCCSSRSCCTIVLVDM